jgi:DNA-binding transcriptional regulator YhcF (GntR family)
VLVAGLAQEDEVRLDPVDPTSGEAPFEQVRRQIATQVTSGELPAGTRLPTVRALATEIGLAVNTVARVYRELEADGVVVTEGRRGTFVSPTAAAETDAMRAAVTTYVEIARRAGLGLTEAQRLVEQQWARHPDG